MLKKLCLVNEATQIDHILCGSIYMKFKSRIMSLGIESRLVVARVVRMLVELNEGNFHYSWRGEGWRGYKALERFLWC